MQMPFSIGTHVILWQSPGGLSFVCFAFSDVGKKLEERPTYILPAKLNNLFSRHSTHLDAQCRVVQQSKCCLCMCQRVPSGAQYRCLFRGVVANRWQIRDDRGSSSRH